jgi:hypothetical protein
MLSKDIEKNPGPSELLDANKTICAPYIQSNEAIFGENAGRQCVAMSLCALVYRYKNCMNSSSDLTVFKSV